MKISGKTQIVAIFGDPLTYTLSPSFQNAGLQAKKLDWVYLPFPVEAKNLRDLWKGLTASGNFRGANVTIPHKLAAMKLADKLSPEAKGIGAVNTLYKQGNKWIGHNTDAEGFALALRQSTGKSLKNKNIVLLGSGGSARAIAWACSKGGASTLVLARSKAKAVRISQDLKACSAGRLDSQIAAGLFDSADIIVNTIPQSKVGKSLGGQLPKRGKNYLVFDITYNPAMSPLLKAAKAKGWRVANGLPMLLEQGVASFKCWTGKTPDKKRMKKALGSAYVS